MPYVVQNNPHPDDALVQALLMAAITKGASLAFGGGLGQVPTGGQGTLNLPGGGTARPGPGLQNQLSNNQLPQLIQQGQFQPGTTYQPATRFGRLPDLDRLSKQTDINYKQEQMKTFTPEYQGNVIRMAQGLSPAGQGGGAQPDVLKLQGIADAADAGDAQAKSFMDYYLSR